MIYIIIFQTTFHKLLTPGDASKTSTKTRKFWVFKILKIYIIRIRLLLHIMHSQIGRSCCVHQIYLNICHGFFFFSPTKCTLASSGLKFYLRKCCRHPYGHKLNPKVFLSIYFIYLKGRFIVKEWERKRSFMCLFTTWIAATARARPDESQKQGDFSRSPTWVQGLKNWVIYCQQSCLIYIDTGIFDSIPFTIPTMSGHTQGPVSVFEGLNFCDNIGENSEGGWRLKGEIPEPKAVKVKH